MANKDTDKNDIACKDALVLQQIFDSFMEEFTMKAKNMGYDICLSDYPKGFPSITNVLYPKDILVNVIYKF